MERSAGLFQEAIAKGDALLTGTAVMYQTSIAEESCRILAGEVWNMAHIRGFAKITAAKETGDAPLILGNSLVFGNVCGKVLVRGNVLPSRSVENQTQELLVFRGGDSIHKVNAYGKYPAVRELIERRNIPGGIYRREKLDNFTWRYAETGESISAGDL